MLAIIKPPGQLINDIFKIGMQITQKICSLNPYDTYQNTKKGGTYYWNINCS